MPSQILDAYGQPAFYSQTNSALYEPIRAVDSGEAARRQRMDKDFALMLGQFTHRDMLSDARYISRWPLVRGMIQQKADYVSAAGWSAHFVGEDDDWGKEAEAASLEADKICDVRGTAFPFDKDWHIGCQVLDVDFDFFVLLTETPNGWPLFQFIEAHRVGSRGSVQIVSEGKWRGMPCINGIVYNAEGREVAYNVLGASAIDDLLIDATDMIRVFDPTRFSTGRDVSPVAYGIRDWYDIKGTRDAEKVAQRANAKLTLIEENETGKRDAMEEAMRGMSLGVSGTGVNISTMDDGLVRYVKSGKGAIKAHESSRPSAGARQFEQDLTMGAAYGMGWRVEMMDLSRLGGAGVRGFQDNINTAILSRFNVLKRYALQLKRYQIAKLIKRGDLRPNADWWKWEYCQPPEFSVDPSRAVQSDIMALRAGLDSEDMIIRRNYGLTPEAFYRMRAKSIKTKRRIAQEEGLAPEDLGILSMPGDPVPVAPDQTQANDQQSKDAASNLQ